MKRPSLEELSLKEKISQILMPSYGQLCQKAADSISGMAKIMEEYQFGSVYSTLIGVRPDENNPDKLINDRKSTCAEHKKVCDEIQKSVRVPILFAADSETGLSYYCKDATPAAPAILIGAANNCDLAEKLAQGIAKEHKAMGSSWRWSPVVDLGYSRFSPGKSRSFSDDVELVSKLAIASIRGQEKENVATNVKHFPGVDPYGYRDSHLSTTSLLMSLEEWEETQGKVFQNMIDAGVMTIMTSHKTFEAVDNEKLNGKTLPTTLSHKIVTGLLREKMGFEGVIITDDMQMGGITTFTSREEQLILAINAGHDILLGISLDDFDIVYKAVLDGRIPMERINESCERVLALKDKIGLFNDKQEEVDVNEGKVLIQEANKEISEKGITLLYDRNNQIPVSKEKVKNVAIVCISHATVTVNELEVMKAEFEKRGAKVKIYDGLSGQIHHGMDTCYNEIVDSNDLIIYSGHLGMHRPMGMPSFYDSKMAIFWYAFTRDKDKAIGVSTGYPHIHYDAMAGADTFVNIYSTAPESQVAFVKAIYGEIPFEGKSPIDVEPKLRQVYC